MTVFLRRGRGAALAYAVATQVAFADVTASDVWADWQQAYPGGIGYDLSRRPKRLGRSHRQSRT